MNKNKRLKIGLFIDNFYPAIDGVVIAVDNIARELSENNDVVYFTGIATLENGMIEQITQGYYFEKDDDGNYKC